MPEHMQEVLDSLAVAETGNNPTYQARTRRPDGTEDRKVGRFGILESAFDGMAQMLGLVGANWRDPKVMDYVVSQRLERDMASWEGTETMSPTEYAITSFKFGTDVAQYAAENEYEPAADYVKAVTSGTEWDDTAIPAPAKQQVSKTRGKAEAGLRGLLTSIRDTQRKGMAMDPVAETGEEGEADGGDSEQPEG